MKNQFVVLPQSNGWEDIQAVLLIMLSVSFVIGFVFFVFYVLQLLDLRQNNIQQCAAQKVELEKLILLSREAQQTLTLLERDTHPSNWQDVKNDFQKIHLDEMTDGMNAIEEDVFQTLFGARRVQSRLDRLEKQLHEHRTLMAMISQRPMRMTRAKFESRYLQEMLSAQVDSTMKIITHPDVSEKTHYLFTRLNSQFAESLVTMTCEDHRAIDWLFLRDQLKGLSREMEIIQREIERDKDAAMRARVDG